MWRFWDICIEKRCIIHKSASYVLKSAKLFILIYCFRLLNAKTIKCYAAFNDESTRPWLELDSMINDEFICLWPSCFIYGWGSGMCSLTHSQFSLHTQICEHMLRICSLHTHTFYIYTSVHVLTMLHILMRSKFIIYIYIYAFKPIFLGDIIVPRTYLINNHR